MKLRSGQRVSAEKLTYKLLFLMVLLTASFIIPNSLDTYFLGKQLLLCLTAVFAFFALLFDLRNSESQSTLRKKISISTLIIFVLAFLIAGIVSGTNMERLLWGNIGRANGFATILSLSIIAAFIILKYNQVLEQEIFAFASFYAKLHCILMLFQHIDGNFLYFNKTYGPVIGLQGNPNFSSALMGVLIPFMAPSVFKLKFKSQEACWMALGLVSILVSNSYSGLIGPIVLLSFVIIKFALNVKTPFAKASLLLPLGTVSGLIILSIFNFGPLASFFYKSSIGIRRYYFEAALRVFADAPLFGVGTDSFGDYFRKYRSVQLLDLIGNDTTTNDAHNFFLNTLSTSGIITILPLSILIILWVVSFAKFLRSEKNYSSTSIAISLASLVYFIQGFFTVHNIAVSLFGIIFASAVISQKSNSLRSSNQSLKEPLMPTRRKFVHLSLATISAVSLILLYLPRIHFDHQAYAILSVEKRYDIEEYKFQIYRSVIPTLEFWIKDPTRSGLLIEELLRMGANLDAESMARKSLQASPYSRDALWALIAVLETQQKREEEIDYRGALIEREPASLDLYLAQIEDLVSIGQSLRARELFTRMESQSRYDAGGLIAQARILVKN